MSKKKLSSGEAGPASTRVGYEQQQQASSNADSLATTLARSPPGHFTALHPNPAVEQDQASISERKPKPHDSSPKASEGKKRVSDRALQQYKIYHSNRVSLDLVSQPIQDR